MYQSPRPTFIIMVSFNSVTKVTVCCLAIPFVPSGVFDKKGGVVESSSGLDEAGGATPGFSV